MADARRTGSKVFARRTNFSVVFLSFQADPCGSSGEQRTCRNSLFRCSSNPHPLDYGRRSEDPSFACVPKNARLPKFWSRSAMLKTHILRCTSRLPEFGLNQETQIHGHHTPGLARLFLATLQSMFSPRRLRLRFLRIWRAGSPLCATRKRPQSLISWLESFL